MDIYFQPLFSSNTLSHLRNSFLLRSGENECSSNVILVLLLSQFMKATYGIWRAMYLTCICQVNLLVFSKYFYTAVIQFQKITTESSSDGVSGAFKYWAALKIQADQGSDKQTPPNRVIEKRNEIFHNKLFSLVHQNIAG